ncbi:hypothetical protein Taro_039517 [Colocasia esculenta]|uniref:Ubiquitin-like protease family profile domain-containing protein n=1 Tax=Colocasia esculenta TaxID=4460 RepID=A0A843WJ44_COLES|nr:hypothetical protein [Colocasia esculenta]
MILLDSLHMAEPLSKESNIRRFVRELYKVNGRMETSRAINSIPLLLPKVPQQSGGEECGVFILYYMFIFAMNAPKSFSRTSYPYFLSEHWFSYDDLDAFEKKIRTFEKRCETEATKSLARKIDSVEIEDKVEGTKNSKIIKDNTLNEERLSMEKRKTRGPTCSHEVHGMESDKKIYVEWNDVGQPVGPGGRSLRTFLGTVARNASKLPIDIFVWNKIPKHLIEDVWDFIKRKYDDGELEKKWIMKDISQKWKYHKYALRRKIFKQSKKTIQVNPPEDLHISTDMWKEAVKIWTSEHWVLQKSGQEMDRSELFIVTHTTKDGIPVNSECVVAIEKIQALKQPQSSASSSQTVASKYDIYSQVLGEDKPGRVRGLGTGPTPATLWGRTTDILKDENKKLGDRVKDLEERIAKLERTHSKFQEENDSVDGGVAPKESASMTKQDAHSVSF